MGRRHKGAAPSMRRHRGKNLAYVYHDGRQIYLGPWNAPETRRAYREWVGRWEAAQAVQDAPAATVGKGNGIAVGNFFAAFLRWAETHYRRDDDTHTSTVALYRQAWGPILAAHRDRAIADLLPRDLRAIVDAWTARKLRRNTVNQRLQLVKYALSWGAEQELIPEATAALLSRVRPLRANRSQATEGDQVTSAPLRSIAAVLRELRRQRFTRVSVAILLTQYYCGCRPSEACRLSLAELHRGGTVQIGRRVHRVPAGVWIFRPAQHKNKHRGKVVVYAIGPRLQRILAPYVAAAEARGDKPGYLFTTSRRPGRAITRRRYAEHIDLATTAARARGLTVEAFSPGQLRHNFLTRADAKLGIVAASRAVSHATISTTEVYTDQLLGDVAAVARQLAADRPANRPAGGDNDKP